jgi:hypothetical protein
MTMVPRFRNGGAEQGDAFEAEFMRLSSLVADMARIGRGVPVEELVRHAPLLDRWVEAARLAPCLVGLASGHPTLPGVDRSIATSDLVLISDDREWARTRSRWYRLGRPGTQRGADA